MNTVCPTAVRLLAAVFLISAPAIAETTYEVSVVQAGVADLDDYTLGPDHDVVLGSSEWAAPTPDDPASPFRGLHGTCFGLTEFDGPKVMGQGYCIYEDADGDSYATSWIPTHELPGGIAGEWSAINGTGKWAGVTGSGKYEIVGAPPGSTARTRTMTGSISLRK